MPMRIHAVSHAVLATLAVCGILAGCTTTVQPTQALKTQAEAYVRTHIADMSPRSAVLGGRFSVTKIDWEDADTAIVSYEDGHISLKGRTNFTVGSGGIIATRLQLVNDDINTNSSSSLSSSSMASSQSSSALSSSSSSAMSSTSSDPRAPRGEGAFCGGIAGFQCQAGLHCDIKETYPDAGGTCVKD